MQCVADERARAREMPRQLLKGRVSYRYLESVRAGPARSGQYYVSGHDTEYVRDRIAVVCLCALRGGEVRHVQPGDDLGELEVYIISIAYTRQRSRTTAYSEHNALLHSTYHVWRR